MASGEWPAGSIWRKWDLHVHTPASHGFRGNWQQLIIQLGNADCDVIGINDYFTVAGYREIIRRLDKHVPETESNESYNEAIENLRKKVLFPVVECRMNNVIQGRKPTSGTRLNFHIIFDPAVAEDVETFIKGLKVYDGCAIGQRYNDKEFLKNVQVSFEYVREKLRGDGNFKEKFLIWIPYDEYGGIGDIDPEKDAYLKGWLTRNADILGSANKAQAGFFLGRSDKYTPEEFKKWIGKKKPCIKGSDSHNTNDAVGKLKDENSKPTDKYCWIKADPTFNGLRQIVNEPEDRVFIGHIPPKEEEVKNNSTRFLSKVVIKRIDSEGINNQWFDCEIPLNTGMVAIIGNKGSGKSALADILALAGNTHCDPQYFSFLKKERFCEKNGGIAKNYEAVSTWADSGTNTVSLYSEPNSDNVELVKYIPQSYLETICTESKPGEKSEFQNALKKVIFSHIPDADKLGTETLNDLIKYKTEELQKRIRQSQQEIKDLNVDICKLEDRTTKEHKAQLKSNLSMKEQELKAHNDNKPPKVEEPNNVTDEQKAKIEKIQKQIEKENEKLTAIDAQIEKQQTKQRELASQIATAQKLQDKVRYLKSEYDRLISDTTSDVSKLGLDISKIIFMSFEENILKQKQEALIAEKASVDNAIAEEGDTSLLVKKQAILSRIKEHQEKLDAPNKRYQIYKQELQKWEQRKRSIEGNQDQPETDTINYFQAQIKFVEEQVPDKINEMESQRKELSKKIYGTINDIKKIYIEMFNPVQKLIEGSRIIKEGFKLTFDSSIVERDFQHKFLNKYISQGVAGSFYGIDGGAKILEKICDDYDFNKEGDAISFIEKITDHLKYDKRAVASRAVASNEEVTIESQLRKDVEVNDLYDYLWSLEYLKPEYYLKLDGKDLSRLSPGERGTLLLVFYLLVDKSNKPIIVDQPEENLDNQTVFQLLIPVIKEAKRRRQVIMVTHNPNIAVVCDAEQIIHSHIDRANGNKVTYTSGSIESGQINEYLVNVLEGTPPAFDNRRSKYHI